MTDYVLGTLPVQHKWSHEGNQQAPNKLHPKPATAQPSVNKTK